MSQACEDFLRGHGRLAGLLWELKPYEPPASLEQRFAAAACAAQANAATASGRSCSTSTSAQPAFEAPAQMAARFGQLAAKLDAAQAPRRDAVLAQIAAGETPHAVLGAPVQPATEAWLKARATPKPTATIQKPPRKAVWWGFSWFDLRLAALAGVLAAVSTQWLIQQLPTPTETALLEAFQSENKTLADAQPAPPQNPVGNLPASPPALARANATSDAAETRQSGAAEAIHALSASQAEAHESASHAAVPEETPVLAAAQGKPAVVQTELKRERGLSDAPAEAAPSAARTAQLARKSTAPPGLRADESPLVTMHEAAVPAAAEKPAAAPAPAAAPMPAAPARPAWPVSASPAPAAAPARPAAMAASAPQSPEAQTRLRVHGRTFNARLSDEPASFSALLPARPAGEVWQVFSSISDDEAARRWLEALRQSMPAENRPARFELVHEAGSESGWLRIQPPSAEAKTR